MNENVLWIVMTALGAAGAAVIGIGMKRLYDRIRERAPQYHSPLLRFRYEAHEAQALRDTMEEKGLLKLHVRFGWLMLAMMAEVLLLLMAATHNITQITWLQSAMFALSGVIWLMGSAECIALPKAPKAASMLSILKWAAFALWTAGMFAGLFIRSTAY